MNSDDIVYLFFLFFSIVFGCYYRKIEDADAKKKIGALLGLLIVLTVSKIYCILVIITILVNSFIILYMDIRYSHIISFLFSFLYLIFFRTTVYFGIPYPPSHTNLVQMILTLKLVGLAFEKNSIHLKALNNALNRSNSSGYDEEAEDLDLNILNIFCYSLNYIGVLTGPYYKYRTYFDHLNKPFHKYDDYKNTTLRKLFPLVPVYAAIYILTDYLWPLSYTQSPDFEDHSFLYRYWYIWPTFLNFRMRIYIGLTLSECVCLVGGMGVYPSFAANQPGHGPTSNFAKLKESCNSSNLLEAIEYDYETVHSINSYATEFYPTLREGMKNWNMTVQYWLANCIYKRFPSKRYRTLATMFVSGVWHGVYSGYYISVGMIPFGLIVEDIWASILLKDEYYLPKKVGYSLMLFLKMQFFSYSALAFGLLDVHKIMHYYNLVYHWMIFFTIFMYLLGRYLIKLKKSAQECPCLNKEK
ncbi:lysophospholipid acyltransferase 7 [Euwallacea similis]|uniref:lysophospholipid acyltransferase 7 n=1 Tax=Euwallacea similis TaxID=1736056 RepID=UPI00344C1364